MATWPTTLPTVSTNYGIDPVDQTIRTEMESGAPRQRRRTTARNDHVTVAWVMTDAQLAIFRTWFESSSQAAGGASWFTIRLAVGTTGLVNCTARFIAGYKVAHLNDLNWSVSANLEIR